MGKIVAIGGGSIGRNGTAVQTTAIDKEIIRLSGKRKPRVLFIPTASSDDSLYVDLFQKHYGHRLGCKVRVLRLKRGRYTRTDIREIILGSDIIYVGGGNTLMMMNCWKRFGVDSCLRAAYKKGIVLAGVSAGAICWFCWGNSDSRQFTSAQAKKTKQLIKVSGLDLYSLLLCPHYDSESYRQRDLKRMMKTTPGVAIALEDCTALEIIDGVYRIIVSKKGKKAYRIFWKNGRYHKETLLPAASWSSLHDVLRK